MVYITKINFTSPEKILVSLRKKALILLLIFWESFSLF